MDSEINKMRQQKITTVMLRKICEFLAELATARNKDGLDPQQSRPSSWQLLSD
jgi:hypothetical protein